MSNAGAYFPQSYLTDMFRFLKKHEDKIQIITYDDFKWSGDIDYANGYPREKQRWLNAIKSGEIDSGKAYLLIQYDLDSRPERAMSLLSHATHLDIPANIMLFARRVDRRLLKTTGALKYTDYPIDLGILRALEKRKFIVGYHSNCYERSGYSFEDAQRILHEDIQELKKEFDINFYTAHGGVPCENGINNRNILPLLMTASEVRWVHNGATPFFNKQFSDGGHNSPKNDPINRDLRDFIKNIVPGGRYRVLVHPQYYDLSFKRSKRFSGTKWYDELLKETENTDQYDSWGDVVLSNFKNKGIAKNGKNKNELSEESSKLHRLRAWMDKFVF